MQQYEIDLPPLQLAALMAGETDATGHDQVAALVERADRDTMQAAVMRRWYEQNLHRGRNETRVGADEFMLALLRVAGNILAMSDDELIAFLRADATQPNPQQDVDALERIN